MFFSKCIAVVAVLLIALDSLLVILRSRYILRKLKERRERWLTKSYSKNMKRFFVLVPLYQEELIVSDAFSNFKSSLGNREDCCVVFITATREVLPSNRAKLTRAVNDCIFYEGGDSTPEILHSLFYEDKVRGVLPNNFYHVINETEETGKYAQLNVGLDFLQGDITLGDIVAVYDADSHPDSQALDMIQSLDEAVSAYQQIPFYPPAFPPRSLSQLLAHAKVLNDFCYTLTRLAIPYYKSASVPRRVGAHSNIVCLIGHGEFVKWQTLQEVGGFLPPSCDSSLGFALGLKGVGIYPLPVIDVASTPNSLRGIYFQGIVWYNGITLMNRERKRLGMKWSFPTLISYCNRVIDNLKWGLYPFVIVTILLLVATRVPVFGAVSIVLAITSYMVRDVVNWFSYRQVSKWTSLSSPNPIPFWYWMILSLAYVLCTRWVWALAPWSVLFSRMVLGRISLKKTSRE